MAEPIAELPPCRKIIIVLVETLFIAKGRVCFLPIAILLSLFIAWLKPYNSIYLSLLSLSTTIIASVERLCLSQKAVFVFCQLQFY